MIGVGAVGSALHSPQFAPPKAKNVELTMVNEKNSTIFAGV